MLWTVLNPELYLLMSCLLVMLYGQKMPNSTHACRVQQNLLFLYIDTSTPGVCQPLCRLHVMSAALHGCLKHHLALTLIRRCQSKKFHRVCQREHNSELLCMCSASFALICSASCPWCASPFGVGSGPRFVFFAETLHILSFQDMMQGGFVAEDDGEGGTNRLGAIGEAAVEEDAFAQSSESTLRFSFCVWCMQACLGTVLYFFR